MCDRARRADGCVKSRIVGRSSVGSVSSYLAQDERRAGIFQQQFPKSAVRNKADPFILAEAEHRQFSVVTYEGTSFRGIPTANWARTMPGVCKHFRIACCTLPEAFEHLGVTL